MNRVIKFRGLRTDGKGWVVGSLIEKYGEHLICFEQKIKKHIGWRSIWSETQVNPETVSQFTGLLDKNGVEIYDQDILDNGKLVYWSDEQACYFCGDTPLCMSNSHREIIGNLHEHKHLLV